MFKFRLHKDSIAIDSTAIAFLSENLLLTSNLDKGTLDVYYVPPLHLSVEGKKYPTVPKVCSFHLPGLNQNMLFEEISFRASPNFFSGHPEVAPLEGTYRESLADPTKAIIVVTMIVSGDHANTQAYDDVGFQMVVHRQGLLDNLPSESLQSAMASAAASVSHNKDTSGRGSRTKSHAAKKIPWSTWGPATTRWFNLDLEHGGILPCFTYGQRFAQPCRTDVLSEDEDPNVRRNDAVIGHLYDFNPWTSKILKRHSAGLYIPPGLGFRCHNLTPDQYTVVRPETVHPSHTKSRNQAPTPSEAKENQFATSGAFVATIVGRLPYVEFKVIGHPNVHELIIDDSRVIGLKVNLIGPSPYWCLRLLTMTSSDL